MNRLNSPLRIALTLAIASVAIAAAIALIVLIVCQFIPDASSARIHWGSHSTALTGVFTSGALEFVLAWAAITLAILFSFAITFFVLAVTAMALGLSAVLVGLPLILVGVLVWWIVRRSNKRQQTIISNGPSAQA